MRCSLLVVLFIAAAGCSNGSSGSLDGGTTDTDTDADTDSDTDTDTDSDTDTDTDTDTVTDTDADCTSGVCCDTVVGTYQPSTFPCKVTTVYSCTSTACGADSQEQDTTQYCSGTSELCNGSTVDGGVTMVDDCTTDSVCEYDTTDSWCTICLYGCSVEDCVGCIPIWTEHTVDGAFDGAVSTYATDVDGDGDMDVLGAARNADDITWWENITGDGTIWAEHTIDGAFDCAESVFAADVDGDGDMDVLGAAYYDDDITWWENTTGNGTIWIEHTVDGFFDGAFSVYAADVDGDGDIDVLGASYDANIIAWWENIMGDGTIWAKYTVDGGFVGASSAYAEDVDGDGDIDLLGTAWNTDDVTWWENTTGDGSIWNEYTVDGSFSFASSVYAADVDGDSDIDVLGAASAAHEITWWENTAVDGTAWTKHAVDGAFEGARSVYAADVDGDGDIDVLGAALFDDDIAWWENDCIP